MSQNASLYRITADTFESLKADPDSFNPITNSVEYAFFDSTHEGLLYIITRNQPAEIKKVLSGVFYPASSLGGIDTPGFSNEDFDTDWEALEAAVHYLTPTEVSTINALLEEMDEPYFKLNFQPEEMNKEGIYPRAWGEDSFDYTSAFGDFQQMKHLFRKAAFEKSYLLPYVG